MQHRIRAREPEGTLAQPTLLEDEDARVPFLSDSSRTPGGAAPRVYLPKTEGEVAWVVRREERVLAVGAQSSLTGGATPQGDAVLSTARLDRFELLGPDRVWAQAGVPLITLQAALAEQGAFYPPAPTFNGAFVGGTVSTNAAGAATWKYGSTREWVQALTVVLASGHVLDVRRGEVVADAQGGFEVELPGGEVLRVPVPGYTMPDVPKRSAGYHAEPGMDLVDLFVGSEGTLGVLVAAELRVLEPEPPVLTALVPLADDARGVELVRRLRDASRATWAAQDLLGLDVRAVESADRRSVELLREDGIDRTHGVELPDGTAFLLFVQLELPVGFEADEALAAYADGDERDSPLKRFLDLLVEHDAMDEAELALPGDRSREEQLLALREGVPVAVNHRVEQAQRQVDPRIQKVAADMIVPFERFEEALGIYRRELEARGLDYAIWGHASDGNVHPNVLPRRYEDVALGYEAFTVCGREVARMGGCPLSEHGTGRNPIKQALLRGLYGDAGIAQMRATKRALDPTGKLARGVLFPWEE